MLRNKHNELETYDKIKAVIYSCETPDHFKVAANMTQNFNKTVSLKNIGLISILISHIRFYKSLKLGL